MKPLTIIGIVLVVLGILGFVFQRVSFTDTETVVDLGPIEVQSERQRTLAIPDLASGAAVVAGAVMIVAGAAGRKG